MRYTILFSGTDIRAMLPLLLLDNYLCMLARYRTESSTAGKKYIISNCSCFTSGGEIFSLSDLSIGIALKFRYFNYIWMPNLFFAH